MLELTSIHRCCIAPEVASAHRGQYRTVWSEASYGCRGPLVVREWVLEGTTYRIVVVPNAEAQAGVKVRLSWEVEWKASQWGGCSVDRRKRPLAREQDLAF